MTLEEFLFSLDIEQLKIDLRIGDAGDSTEYDEDQILIMMSNQKKVGSVMNIALPSGTNPSVSSPIKRQKNAEYSFNKQEMEENLNAEEDEEQPNGKRSWIQRKAKTNHAFFSNNYSYDNVSYKDNTKRRKTGINEEVIIRTEGDTKICINNYALQQYNEEHKEEQEIEELKQFEKEMQAHSEIDGIWDNPREIIKDIDHRDYGYYENSVLSHHESIDDIINEKHKIDDFKGFNILQNYSQLDSNINLNSHMNDYIKGESLNFNESKTIKADEKLKIDTVDECNLFKIPNHSMSLIDNFDW